MEGTLGKVSFLPVQGVGDRYLSLQVADGSEFRSATDFLLVFDPVEGKLFEGTQAVSGARMDVGYR